MKPIFAIDPGTEKSAYVRYFPWRPEAPIAGAGHIGNDELLRVLQISNDRTLGVIEVMQYYGPNTHAGADVFTTCEWTGKFDLQWYRQTKHSLERLTKPQVSHHLCNKRNAVKAELRAVLYQRFGDGSRRSAMGVKKAPGPLYGLTGDHVWDALALAVTWHEQNQAAI